MLVGMRPDPVQGNFEFPVGFPSRFRLFFRGIFNGFSMDYRAEKEKVAAILCAILRENFKKGESPLDPHRFPQENVP